MGHPTMSSRNALNVPVEDLRRGLYQFALMFFDYPALPRVSCECGMRPCECFSFFNYQSLTAAGLSRLAIERFIDMFYDLRDRPVGNVNLELIQSGLDLVIDAVRSPPDDRNAEVDAFRDADPAVGNRPPAIDGTEVLEGWKMENDVSKPGDDVSIVSDPGSDYSWEIEFTPGESEDEADNDDGRKLEEIPSVSVANGASSDIYITPRGSANYHGSDDQRLDEQALAYIDARLEEITRYRAHLTRIAAEAIIGQSDGESNVKESDKEEPGNSKSDSKPEKLEAPDENEAREPPTASRVINVRPRRPHRPFPANLQHRREMDLGGIRPIQHNQEVEICWMLVMEVIIALLAYYWTTQSL
jgi:hypothetical protein